MQSANNGLGDVYITGFTAAMRIKQFAMCPCDAIATGVSTFCGQNLGAGKTDRIKKGILQGVFVGMAYGLVAGIVLIFFGRTLTLLFVKPSATAVLDASAKYLRCLGFFYWSLGILNLPNDHTGSWLFRQSYPLGRRRNGGTLFRQSGIGSYFSLQCNLLCRSKCLDHCYALHRTDLSACCALN